MGDRPKGLACLAAAELAHQLSGVQDRASQLSVAARLLAAVLPGDVTAWDEIDLAPGRAEVASPMVDDDEAGRSGVVPGADPSEAGLALARELQSVLALVDHHVQLAESAAGPAPAGGPVPAGRCGLTDRELEVLGHVARGLTADAVARLLRISGRTVRKHLENAYRKLDRHDRLLAVQRARELGLVPELRAPVERATTTS